MFAHLFVCLLIRPAFVSSTLQLSTKLNRNYFACRWKGRHCQCSYGVQFAHLLCLARRAHKQDYRRWLNVCRSPRVRAEARKSAPFFAITLIN